MRWQAGNAGNRELSASQRFAGQFIQLADTQDALDGFIGDMKLGGFVRVDDGGQLCQIVNIADRLIFFLQQIPALTIAIKFISIWELLLCAVQRPVDMQRILPLQMRK